MSKKLGELSATAICGNDLSSSCLYISVLTFTNGGQYVWVSLLMVDFVFFLFRKIFTEVVVALPLTGGACNALLNTTSYIITFLSVVTLFGFGNIILKVKRKNLHRPEKSTWVAIILASGAVIAAFLSNKIMNPNYLWVFLEYLIPSLLLAIFMINRTIILKFCLKAIKYLFKPIEVFVERTNNQIINTIDTINSQKFVFFTYKDDVATLNKVML